MWKVGFSKFEYGHTEVASKPVCVCVRERGNSPKMYEVGSGFLINISVHLL